MSFNFQGMMKGMGSGITQYGLSLQKQEEMDLQNARALAMLDKQEHYKSLEREKDRTLSSEQHSATIGVQRDTLKANERHAIEAEKIAREAGANNKIYNEGFLANQAEQIKTAKEANALVVGEKKERRDAALAALKESYPELSPNMHSAIVDGIVKPPVVKEIPASERKDLLMSAIEEAKATKPDNPMYAETANQLNTKDPAKIEDALAVKYLNRYIDMMGTGSGSKASGGVLSGGPSATAKDKPADTPRKTLGTKGIDALVKDAYGLKEDLQMEALNSVKSNYSEGVYEEFIKRLGKLNDKHRE